VDLLNNIGGWELIMIMLVGFFIFGPDRLPKAISEAVRTIRKLREMARNATGDLSRELGTDIDLEDLNPKTFLRKHLLSEEDEEALRRPLQGVYDELRGVADSVTNIASSVATDLNKTASEVTTGVAASAGSVRTEMVDAVKAGVSGASGTGAGTVDLVKSSEIQQPAAPAPLEAAPPKNIDFDAT
jgi:sec-independent protein translocase protein TatB